MNSLLAKARFPTSLFLAGSVAFWMTIWGQELPLPRGATTLSEVRRKITWLNHVYASATNFDQFNAATTEVIDFLPSGDATHVEKNLASRDDISREIGSLNASLFEERLNEHDDLVQLRRKFVDLLIGIAKRPELIHACRETIIASIGGKLSDDEFPDFRDAILLELCKTVWRERIKWGYHTNATMTSAERQLFSSLSAQDNNDAIPPEAFPSFAIGLYRAGRMHGANEGLLVRERLRDLLQIVPISSDGNRTTICALAFGDNREDASRVRQLGFFPLIEDVDTPDAVMLNEIRTIYNACEANWINNRVFEVIAGVFDTLSTRIDEQSKRIDELELRLSAVEKRLISLEMRMSRVEVEITQLWKAIYEEPIFIREYSSLLRNGGNLPLTASTLGLEKDSKLLKAVAPILLSHNENPGHSPLESRTETIVSVSWLVSHCGLVNESGTPAFDINVSTNLEKLNGLFTAGASSSQLSLLCIQNSPFREGPLGNKGRSFTNAIDYGLGVYGLVQKLGTTMFSVQYYVLFPYNAATIDKLDIPFFYKKFNHGGDWLCIDIVIRLVNDNVERPVIVMEYLHNHGPVIEVSPEAIEMEGNHSKIYLEWGCNEPQPRPGGQGQRHTEIPGIRRNRRISDAGIFNLGGIGIDVNERIERLAIRPHLGTGFRYETQNVDWYRKNLNSNDPECIFIRFFEGRWGFEGDSPRSPFWNDTMRNRMFEPFH